jgi:YidC/Oxa1 family membrane protein insertase
MGSSTRVVLTVVICLGILLLWSLFFAPKTQDAGKGPEPSASKESKEARERPGERPREVEKTERTEGAPPAERVQADRAPSKRAKGQSTKLDAQGGVALFTDRGGALESFLLTREKFREERNGKLVPVDLVQSDLERGLYPLTISFPKSDFDVPEGALFKRVQLSPKEVRYEWSTARAKLSKHFVVDTARQLIWMTVSLSNLSASKLQERLELRLFNRQESGVKASFTNPYPRIPTVLCYVNGVLERRSAGAISGETSGCSAAGCGMGQGAVSQTGEVLWFGSDDRYFLTAVVPQDQVEGRRCDLKLLEKDLVQASLLHPEKTIEPGKTGEWKFAVFVGPKDLKSLDAERGPGGSEVHLSEAIEFGWLAVLCRPMLWLMQIFFSVFGNWGVAIILLTVVVKLLTLYWTQKSMRSMKEMQRLKPKMDELRERYKDDKERLNQELMSLYKVHKVNPLGGCLPMLIQMPIWFALYRTLGNAVELYRSDFIFWIKDLTAPDQYYVLPIVLGAAQYAQQLISPQPIEGTQAKVMKYFMPGMFTVMMLALPSGLTLYIFVNTLLTIVHQWYMNKTDPHRGEAAKPPGPKPREGARVEGTPRDSGRGTSGRGARRRGGKGKADKA